MNTEAYLEAKNKFLSGDYSVQNFFKQNNFVLEYAYCMLLQGNLPAAKSAFAEVSNSDFRANWANKLIQFIERQVYDIPTYFQIRNFLEIDLNLLINAKQPEYVENIINGADLFFSINPESYKFISRVMINNDFSDVSLYYLLKAKDKFYYDPELHFMLANCYIKRDEKVLAIESLNNCLCILPEYFPAQKLLTKLLQA